MSDGEVVIARLRPHARALFWPTVVLLAAAAGLGFSSVFRETWQQVLVLVIAGLVLLAGWFAPLCRWLATNYTITSRRLVVRSGIVVRSRQEMLHAHVHDITVRRGVLQTVFRSGDVLVDGGTDRPVVLRDVPGADLVQEALFDLAEV